MNAPTNAWCQALGIDRPKLEAVASHREANNYALLLVALLERGGPMTLPEVALRFEEAGVAGRREALRSLQRCKPARPPVYREGEMYHLDPYDQELDLWAFRLDLRPPKYKRVASAAKSKAEGPLPGPEVALTRGELDEAWRDASLYSWARQRVVLAVLDAEGGPLPPAQVVAAVGERTQYHPLHEPLPTFNWRGSAIAVLDHGRWSIAPDAEMALTQARAAVRERVSLARRHAAMRPDLAEIAARQAEAERERAAHRERLSAMSRAVLVAFPPSCPEAVALLDVGARQIVTAVGAELEQLRDRIERYEILAGMNIRGMLQALGIEPAERRLAELGPSQKTLTLNRAGRSLKITTAMLVQGSCGISKPFGEGKLDEYLARGEMTKLRRRLEADVKSLYALYEYGRTHGVVRLRWGFLDERISAPWVHRDEDVLYNLKRQAAELNVPLEVVLGAAPSWDDPWSRAQLVWVEKDRTGWQLWLTDEDGFDVDEGDIQRARLAPAVLDH